VADESERHLLPKKNAPILDGLFATVTITTPEVPRDTAGWATRWASLSPLERKAQRERWKVQLLPIVMDLAARRGAEGFTAADVQSDGITAGVLNGESWFLKNPLPVYRNVYAWIGQWLSYLADTGTLARVMETMADGRKKQVERESTRKASKGNPGGVFVLAELARAAA
jgi:hypothetical protein